MRKSGVVKVATCQFPVCADVDRNAAYVRRQMLQARKMGADAVHFPEAALSGYGGSDLATWDDFDWARLRCRTEEICELAARHHLWVVLGSAHPLTGRHLPHNSLYLIGPDGSIVDRYDKRFCTGGPTVPSQSGPNGDLKFYTPGDHAVLFEINGVRCGLLICYDVRFPELYRDYVKQHVQLMFHSFYNARAHGRGILTTIMRPTLQAHAATNYMWISACNSSARYQSWPAVFVRPNGEIAASLSFHRTGVMVNTADTNKKLYDASGPWRARSMKGILHSGRTVRDRRSRDRRSL